MTTQPAILLNADLGESPEALRSGRDDEIAAHCDIINIACGGHAGTTASMHHFIALAGARNIRISAHPSYPDRANFGRVALDIPSTRLADSLRAQLTDFGAIAASLNVPVRHIKPHGALYHQVGTNADLARLFASLCHNLLPTASLILQANAATLPLLAQLGTPVLTEAFADRTYEPDGSLRSRELPEALLTSPAQIASQISTLIAGPLKFETLCLHADTPNALELISIARSTLDSTQGPIRSFPDE